ncbi:MAG TPA: NAD(P)-dependent oxidoreductase [Thermoanaerobaculia bacterium]|nr:NAD(P)-dependent oxidoreductase [Thermoanaerobaculia bacterium]
MVSADPIRLAGARVLVTGASGFLGAARCRRRAGAGARVHGTSRRSELSGGGIEGGLRGDLADAGFAREVVAEAGPEVLFHLASEVTGSREPEAVLPTVRGNLVSAVNVLLAAREAGCRRVVVAGSMEEPEPARNGEPPVPASPYAAAKGAATAYARMFHALWGLPVVTARVFMVYGPAQPDLRKLVPYVTLALLRGEHPRLSSGRRPVDWIYVDDAVEGLVALGTAPGIDGERLDLGSGELVRVREVAERLAAIARRPASSLGFGELPDRPMEQVRTADVARTRERTGWRPAVSLDEGLGRTVDWYREALEAGRLPGA